MQNYNVLFVLLPPDPTSQRTATPFEYPSRLHNAGHTRGVEEKVLFQRSSHREHSFVHIGNSFITLTFCVLFVTTTGFAGISF